MSIDGAAPLSGVGYDARDGLATVTLDRPDAMNSLDTATKEALLDAVQRAAAADDVRAVVLTGTGRAFCVGQDLREHARAMAEQSLDDVWSTVERHYSPIALALATMDKPVIAAVNGVAAGAGLSLVLACDLRIAADTASFTTAFAGIGLACDTGCSWSLPRIVGPTRAMDLLLTPRSVKADEALAIGLVNAVVPAGGLAAEAATLGNRLAAGPTRAYAAIKKSVAYGAAHRLDESLAFEATMMAWTGGSADHRNAVDAFMAKRKPEFTGS